MSLPNIVYRTSTATHEDLCRHLHACNRNFTPRLDERVDLEQYSRKLVAKAATFEAWQGANLVSLVAAYFNDTTTRCGFVTSVSTVEECMGHGLSNALMQQCIERGRHQGFHEIRLEVDRRATAAIRLYLGLGFLELGTAGDNLLMKLDLAADQPNGRHSG